MTAADDAAVRAELIHRLTAQERIDDPFVGFTDAAGIRASEIWPDERWLEVRLVRRITGPRREVTEYVFRRATGEPAEVPAAIVWDGPGADARARIYFNKTHFGSTEPRRPIIAPEPIEEPDDLAAYERAVRGGDRAGLEAIIADDAVIGSPHGDIDKSRFIDIFATREGEEPRGVPLQYCTLTSDGSVHACEFVSWRRPPHGGLAVYAFDRGRLQQLRVYEGPVYH